MRIHLYEFHSEKKRLKCLCGWERVLKSTDVEAARERFAAHCEEARELAQKP
jgi:hypothetical protein